MRRISETVSDVLETWEGQNIFSVKWQKKKKTENKKQKTNKQNKKQTKQNKQTNKPKTKTKQKQNPIDPHKESRAKKNKKVRTMRICNV